MNTPKADLECIALAQVLYLNSGGPSEILGGPAEHHPLVVHFE